MRYIQLNSRVISDYYEITLFPPPYSIFNITSLFLDNEDALELNPSFRHSSDNLAASVRLRTYGPIPANLSSSNDPSGVGAHHLTSEQNQLSAALNNPAPNGINQLLWQILVVSIAAELCRFENENALISILPLLSKKFYSLRKRLIINQMHSNCRFLIWVQYVSWWCKTNISLSIKLKIFYSL